MTASTIFRLVFIVAALLIVAFTARKHIGTAMARRPGLCMLLLVLCMLAVAALDTPK